MSYPSLRLPPNGVDNRPSSRGSASSGHVPQPGNQDQALPLDFSTLSGSKHPLDVFSASDFNVTTLIASLTDGLIAQSKEEGGAFNPLPFISSLESAVDQLIPLRKDISSRTALAEKQVQAAERQYAVSVKDIRDSYTAVTTGFANLETRIAEVGRTTVRVGDELETMDRLRTRASEARDIITYYHEFAKGDLTRIEALRKEGRDGRAKVAVILRRLASVAKEIEDVEGGDTTRDAIAKYCERFETDMLKLFDRYYRKGDPKMMNHCAKTLLDFNGGQSCISIYINQHDFFISKDRVQDASAITDTPMWDTLPDPDAPAPRSEPGLSMLYDEIRVTVDQEGKIITAVFPNPPVVMQVFLQRVLGQVIQTYVERLIDTSSTSSTLAFLRVLYLARASSASLIEDLKQLDFFRSSSSTSTSSGLSSPTADASSMAGLSVLSGNLVPANTASAAAVSQILDLALGELFSPYMEKYMSQEQKSLTELYASYLVKFTRWHRENSKSGAKSSGGMFDRMVDKIAQAAQNTNASATAASMGQQGASGLKHLMKLGGLNLSDKQRRDSSDSLHSMAQGQAHAHERSSLGASALAQQQEMHVPLMVTEKDGQISLEVAERMLKWHAEAVGRMLELSSPSEAPKNAFTLLKVLVDNFGQAYLETALDTAVSIISTWDTKSEPPVECLKVVREMDLAVQLWQRYVSTALMPLAGSSLAVRREMTAFNSQTLSRIEGKVNELMQRTTAAVTSWLSTLLARQKRNDFKPKTDTDLFESERTEPCAACCRFISRVREVVVSSVSGKNQDGLLTDIGVTFHSLLLEHFKKFPVGDTGTILLTKDLAAYQDAMQAFNIPIVTERFEMLRQLGKLFEVQVEVLRSFLDAEHLSRIDRRLLRPYIMLRSDYDRYPKKVFEEVFGDSVPGESGRSKLVGRIADKIESIR